MLTLGIVNTYDKIKVHEAHYRSIARAAPVAYAFGFNLALFDYPFRMTAEELVSFVKDKTTIGSSGKYLEELFRSGRFFVFDLPEKGFQPQFGSPVVTTSHPAPGKKTDVHTIAENVNKRKSFLFLIGLGHKGLPRELFEMAEFHLDITSRGVSLETCTAIGAVPAIISGCAERIKSQK
ncbi:MAG: DUF531 domain-containing protein [Candidatus Methanoperedens sp.]|nr:DUF531 domain-containing protein [Candidatus Methanoperedens sp.]MCZ7369097.1 DUF531 domain-containing protein [Candidatus Methanoperedens sp.]